MKGLLDYLYSGQASGLKENKEQLFDLGAQYELPGSLFRCFLSSIYKVVRSFQV